MMALSWAFSLDCYVDDPQGYPSESYGVQQGWVETQPSSELP